jgi:polysaccharide export outer membrane protein
MVWTLLLAGCATQSAGMPAEDTAAVQKATPATDTSKLDELNMRLALQAHPVPPADDESYRIGPADLLAIAVFSVPELSQELRVAEDGTITLPLVGAVAVAGLTVTAARDRMEQGFSRYLRQPQVSVTVKEYGSRRITVMGAVNQPQVYLVGQAVRLMDVLAMAGGLTKESGSAVHVMDQVKDESTGQTVSRSMVVNLDDLLKGYAEANITLGYPAVVNVPNAGVFFVQGAVLRPGAYPVLKDMSAAKAIGSAGGFAFVADGSAIKVFRPHGPNPGTAIAVLDYKELLEHPDQDVKLQEGDVVVVPASGLRSAWAGFRSIFSFGAIPLTGY